jgi:hypothetical protein
VATYCFYCTFCGRPYALALREEAAAGCVDCDRGFGVPLKRNYRAENVGVHTVGLKREREGGDKARSLMLPSNKDFAGPGDPDGHSGLRQWREEFQPKADNKRPKWPGDLPKKSF